MALAAKHLYIDSVPETFMDRDVDYSDQHQYPDPVPVLGPSLVPLWLTGASVTHTFDSSDSWALDGGALTYVWACATASATADLTTTTPDITFDATGHHVVTCVVSRDYGGGNVKTTKGYRYVLVYSTAAMPVTEFTLDNCSGSWDSGGWSFQVTLHNATDADVSAIRDRAWVVLFAKDWYGGTEVSHGPIDNNEQTIAIGWVAEEGITWNPEEGEVAFTVQGPVWWMQKMRGFPMGVEDVQTTPTKWEEFETLDVRSGVWHFLHWRSTLPIILDITLTGDTRGVAEFSGPAGTLGDQLISVCWATIRAKPCGDRFGRLYVQIEQQLVPTGDRGGFPTVLTLTTDDLRVPIVLERRIVPAVTQVDLSGISYSAGTGTPLFSLSPGHIPKSFGDDIEQADRLALSSQAQANALAGYHLGWLNAEYPSIVLPFASNMRMVDVCPHQLMALTISATHTIRGLSQAITLVARSVQFSYDYPSGQLLTDVTAESVTVNAGSQDGDIPADPPDPDPDPSPDDDWDPFPDPVPGWPSMVIAATKGDSTEATVGEIYKTSNFTDADPTWASLAGTGLPATRYFQDFNADPANKESKLYVMLSQVSFSDTTAKELWYSSDSGATFTKIMDVATADAGTGETGEIDAFMVDPVTAGTIYVGYYTGGWSAGNTHKTYLCKSTDWGSTWSYILVRQSSHNWAFGSIRGVGQDLWCGGGWFADKGASVFVTHDGGSNWTGPTDVGTGSWIPYIQYSKVSTVPYMNGDNSNEDLLHFTDDTTYSVDRDSDDIPPKGQHNMYLSVNDALRMWVINTGVPYYTDDGWSTMTSGSECSINASHIGWCGDYDDDDDYKRMILLNSSAGDAGGAEDPQSIFTTDDFGTTVTDKSGANHNTGPGYTNAIPSIQGGVVAMVAVDRDFYH
jgi:hypothetical protein